MMKKLFSSKKFVGFLIGAVLECLAASGVLNLDEATKAQFMTSIAGLVAAYVVGQGVADLGKEKAKVEKGQE